MIKTREKTCYKAFGFSVESEINLPELVKLDSQSETMDVEIVIEDLAEIWEEESDDNFEFVIKKNYVMFQVPQTAIFLIQNGNKISVSPLSENKEDVIRLYLLGICMGTILMHRKIFPLHGSAVAINGKAYAFVGDSGAGKSTLASGLINLGYELISDDVIAVSFVDNVPMVIPSYPQQKLWRNSLQMLGMEESYKPIYGREEKFCVPVSSNFTSTKMLLGGIFELIKTDKDVLEIKKLEGLERFHKLFYHTYQNPLITDLGLMEWHFKISAILSDFVDIFQVKRPETKSTADIIVSKVLSTINNKGDLCD